MMPKAHSGSVALSQRQLKVELMAEGKRFSQIFIIPSGQEILMGKRIAFFMDYDRYGREEAPAILQFIQTLRNHGHSVDFMSSEGELLERLPRGYDIVALSVFSSLELRDVLKTAIRVKQADSRVVSVLGGHGVAENASKLILATGIDAVVEGEAENTFPLMLKHLEKAREAMRLTSRHAVYSPDASQAAYLDAEAIELLRQNEFRSPVTEEMAQDILGECFTRRINYRGKELEIEVPITGVYIKTRDGGMLYSGSATDEEVINRVYRRNKKQLGDTMSKPELARFIHAYPTKRELEENFTGYPWDIVEAKGWHALSLYVQRGCNWGRCEYCSITTPAGRSISVEKVIALLREATRHGVRDITFDDDQFVQSQRWVAELCRGILREKLNRRLRFGAMLRVDAIRDFSLLRLMKEAGFAKVQLGVESLVPEKIAYFRKTLPGREEEYIQKASALIDACMASGLDVGIFVITTRPKKSGALEEVASEIEALLQLLLSLYRRHRRLPTISFNDMLMAYPGAPLLKKEKYKRMLVPVAISGGGKRMELVVIEVPYIFELRSIQLANYLAIVGEMAKRRGMAPEQLNETLEHFEDLINAIKVAAQHLSSEMSACLEYLSALDDEGREELAGLLNLATSNLEKALLSGTVSIAKLKRAVERTGEENLRELGELLPARLGEAGRKLEKRCEEMERILYAVEGDVYMRVKTHLSQARAELRDMERQRSGKSVRRIRDESQKLLDRYYPYYLARSSLQNLLTWLEEYERCLKL